MENRDLLEIESSQRQRYEEILYQEKSYIMRENFDYNLFALLKPKLSIDGNQWCCLYGEDLQCGVAGFGESPHDAIIDWNSAWNKKLN